MAPGGVSAGARPRAQAAEGREAEAGGSAGRRVGVEDTAGLCPDARVTPLPSSTQRPHVRPIFTFKGLQQALSAPSPGRDGGGALPVLG